MKMEILNYEIKGNKYQFCCETWETSRAWGHKVHLLRNGYELVEEKVRYYNRTWECYRYQTCMFACIRTLINELETKIILKYKEENNVNRLTKVKREEILNNTTNKDYLEYKELYNQVKLNRGTCI